MQQRRRPPRYTPLNRRAGSLFVSGTASRRHRRRRRLPWAGILAALLVVGLAVSAVAVVRSRQAADDRRRDAAVDFVAAWERGDLAAMWRLTGGRDRPARADFERSYAQAAEAAGVEKVQAGEPGALRDDRVRVPVTVRTDDFGTLEGPLTVRTADEDGRGVVLWTPALRLPGLREDEDVRRKRGKLPARGEVLAADGGPLAADPIGAGIAGSVEDPETGRPSGLERLFDDRLAGRPASTLRFGDRVIKEVEARKGRDVHSTIRLGLSRAAESALGGRLGGVAVVRPRDGAVLALAGLAVSAPQAPGSTFKIITLAGALEEGVVDPDDSFPVQQFATLSGVKLYNAGSESCGGSLATSFAKSCNSVFAPLGAKLGRKRLLAVSERFGFNEQPRVPAAKPSTIAADLRDDLAEGAAAIGQERDLATPLQMASVGATIANGGVRMKPRIAREQPKRKRRVVSERVAARVRDMMVGVVAGGTGTAAALPGVTVAGKTGTAELVSTQGQSQADENTNAWFVSFAPARGAQLAVAVMLVGAGHGGTSAAPVARQVMQAGL